MHFANQVALQSTKTSLCDRMPSHRSLGKSFLRRPGRVSCVTRADLATPRLHEQTWLVCLVGMVCRGEVTR